MEISTFLKLAMVGTTIMCFIIFTAGIQLVSQQLYYIYNDVPYLDLIKKPNLEAHWPCLRKRADEFMVTF